MRARESPASHPSPPAPPGAPSSRRLQSCMGGGGALSPPRAAPPVALRPKGCPSGTLGAHGACWPAPSGEGLGTGLPPLLAGLLRTACPCRWSGWPLPLPLPRQPALRFVIRQGTVAASVLTWCPLPAGRAVRCLVHSARYHRPPCRRSFPAPADLMAPRGGEYGCHWSGSSRLLKNCF